MWRASGLPVIRCWTAPVQTALAGVALERLYEHRVVHVVPERALDGFEVDLETITGQLHAG
jgi:hypothetical protein